MTLDSKIKVVSSQVHEAEEGVRELLDMLTKHGPLQPEEARRLNNLKSSIESLQEALRDLYPNVDHNPHI